MYKRQEWSDAGWDGRGEQLAAWQSVQPQPSTQQTEDCLTLTVRSPVGATPLPVMCWIHVSFYSPRLVAAAAGAHSGSDGGQGGNHQDGRAEQPDEPRANALPDKGVVLVKINYRLGIFGYYAHPNLPDTNYGTSE